MPQALSHDDPEKLGHYRLVARLGTGGMGTVYVGRSPGGRVVALKTMHPHIASKAEFRTRFRLEIDAARVIGGQFGAVVVDADPLAETPWLATEYVLGPSLDEAVGVAGPLPEPHTRALGAALCAALAQLHRSDVVHRDLKPSNILVTASGPKLIDFGIARAIGDERLTRAGAAAGTPAFMSPEQATGAEHGASGDVFALAGVLVFALTGSGPFGQGQPADLLYRVRYGEADLTGVPEGVQPLLRWCLDKDPACRPGTEELAEALLAGAAEYADSLPPPVLAEIATRCAEACEAPPSRMPPPSDAESTAPSVREKSSVLGRRRVLMYSGGGALAAASVGFGVWSWRSGGDESSGSPSRGPRAANEPPEPLWQSSVSEVAPTNALRAAGGLVLVGTKAGHVAIDVERGRVRWTSGKEFMGAGAMETAGNRIIGNLGLDEVMVSRINPKAGTVGREIVSGTDLDDTQLIAARADALYLSAKVKKGKFSGSYCVLRLDPTSGEESWRQRISKKDGMGAQDFVAEVSGRHFVLASGETVRVTDARTGEELWKRRIPREKEAMSPLAARGSLAVTRTHVYIGAQELLALRLRDGEIEWRFGEGRHKGKDVEYDRLYGPPTVDSGTVYVAEKEGGLLAVDATSGKLLWQAEQDGQEVESQFAPIVGKKYIYNTVDDSRWIVAVDRKKHTPAWTFTGLRAGGTGRSALLHPASGRVIVASGGVVAAVPLE